MRINTNVSAINSARNLQINQQMLDHSMRKLSSGFRIARAADDAAGLGIANKLRADIGALGQASNNAEQANSLLQIAEGATSSIARMLERLKVLATQAGSDTVDSAGRQRIQEEYNALAAEIDRTVSTTKFQGSTLLDGTFANYVDKAYGSTVAAGYVYSNSTILHNTDAGTGATVTVQDVLISGTKSGNYTFGHNVGATSATLTVTTTNGNSQSIVVSKDGAQQVSFSQFGITLNLTDSFDTATRFMSGASGNDVLQVGGSNKGQFLVGSSGSYGLSGGDFVSVNNFNLSSSTLGISALDLTTLSGATTALSAIDNAIGVVNSTLGSIGASQNRIESAAANLKVSIQNFSAAQSVIRDLDMAEEMTQFTKTNILVQAGTSMLAQANQSQQSILSLLRG